MSRTKRGNRGNREWWKPRRFAGAGPGGGLKDLTNRIERRVTKQLLREDVDPLELPQKPMN